MVKVLHLISLCFGCSEDRPYDPNETKISNDKVSKRTKNKNKKDRLGRGSTSEHSRPG